MHAPMLGVIVVMLLTCYCIINLHNNQFIFVNQQFANDPKFDRYCNVNGMLFFGHRLLGTNILRIQSNTSKKLNVCAGIASNRLNARRSTEEVLYTKNQTCNIRNDPSLQLVVALPSPVLSTPSKKDPKKRRKSAIDKPEQSPKLKNHRPQVLHEDYTPEIFTPKAHARRIYDGKKSSKTLSNYSNDVGIGQAANKSCKRALNFDLESTYKSKILEDNGSQDINLDLEKKQEKQFIKKYQRRKKRIGNTGLNMETSEYAGCSKMDCLSVMDARIPSSDGVDCDFIMPESCIQGVSSKLREILMKEVDCEQLFSRGYSRRVKVKHYVEYSNDSGENFLVMHKKEKMRRQKVTVSRSWLGVKTAEVWQRKRNSKDVVKKRQRKLQPLQFSTPTCEWLSLEIWILIMCACPSTNDSLYIMKIL